MPKMKTISSAKKRFKITGSGGIRRAKAYKNHCLEHKTSKQGRRLRQKGMVDESQVKMIKRMLLAS